MRNIAPRLTMPPGGKVQAGLSSRGPCVWRIVSVIAAMLLIALGCESCQPTSHSFTSHPSTGPAGNLAFLNAAGDVVAMANIDIPETLPAGDGAFRGRWNLLWASPAFPSRSAPGGSYAGSVQNGSLMSINLHPGVMDSNVVLTWSPGTLAVTGIWYHATISGGEPMGTFVWTRRVSGVR